MPQLQVLGRTNSLGRPESVSSADHFIRNFDEFWREAEMAKQVNCDCGFMVRTQSEDEMVEHVQLHAREIHQMDVPRDKALEMAKNVEATVTV